MSCGDAPGSSAATRPPVAGATFSGYMCEWVSRLRRLGRARTAENYAATLSSLLRFSGREVGFEEFDHLLVEEYESHLKAKGNTPNTTSFYMRNLRAAYNRAVMAGLTVQRRPFRGVYTGVEKTLKRALTLDELKRVRDLDLRLRPALGLARDLFMFSFLTRGMSFIDMAYLRKRDVAGGILTYRRRKTGQLLHVKWEAAMQQVVEKYLANPTDFLLPIIVRPDTDFRAQYANAQRRTNAQLKQVAVMAGLRTPLSMYAARHSWASVARSINIPVSVISEGMGHDSEATTNIYLAALDTAVVDNANSKIINLL